MENLRGFEYKYNVSNGKIMIKDLRFNKKIFIHRNYEFDIQENVINFLESKNIKIEFCVTDNNIVLSKDFDNQIK